MQASPFPILYEDEHLVLINKPTGILVHRTKISEDTIFVLQLLRNQLKQKVYPIHRLDRATSGALLFAKSSVAAAHLSEQFRMQHIKKEYLAIIRGFVAERETIDYPLAPEPHLAKQTAITHFKRLAQQEIPVPIGPYSTARYSLVRIRTETGRRHQIRKHFSHLRHPIIGDKKHGDIKHNKYFREALSIPRMLLHAAVLEFPLFQSEAVVRVEAPLDELFKLALEHLNFNDL